MAKEVQAKVVSNNQLGVKVDQLEKEIGKLDKKITQARSAISRVERKVFNGFGARIDAMTIRIGSVETKIDANKVDNVGAHTEMKKILGGIIKFGATSLILIFIVLLSILGSIWFHDNKEPTKAATKTEVQVSAPIDSNIAAE